MTELLQFKNLVTEFTIDGRTTRAVNDVSFSLKSGETVGVVGESGSGKSVTSLSAMRLIPSPPGKIVSGQILYKNRKGKEVDLLQLPEKEMCSYRGNELAMIFQEPMTSLNPVMTCGYQVAESLRLHKNLSKADARLQTIAWFEKVKLPRPAQIYDAYPHQVSGGQKQRVMIAMAMCCDPSILIADEPTTALDVTVQATILDLMRKLQEESKMGMLFITHDLGVIAELAHRVVVMYRGKVVEEGTVSELFSHPKHPYTKGLLACRPPLERKVRKLPVVSDFMREENGVMSELPPLNDLLESNTISVSEATARLNALSAKPPILKVEDLRTWFPVKKGIFGRTTNYVKAVDDVSFEVYPGETLGLVGESGCGKTTLGRTLLRLVEPTGGRIIFEGDDITKLEQQQLRKKRKEMQIVFQDPYSSLNPRMTAGAAIMEPMQVHHLYENDKVRKERVLWLLSRVNLLPEHFNRYPHEFSGGQRQRICIARALSLNPKFIVCDESVSALDVSVQAQVLNLLNELRNEFGFTYIFISHDLSVVNFMSDRIVVMNKGKIEEMGSAHEVYAHPQSAYTKRLIAAIPKGL
ncbi:MAG TPA: ABC transporter ATP-binding protein [Bacteroidia bacterium]|nr:ABC transporter ATP-binding protein [Bacteroidia bacterium]